MDVSVNRKEPLLEEQIVGLLQEKKVTLATAESCTGGMLASRIIDVPGVSEVFKAGFVTYANEAKQNLIGVKEDTLAQFGAVSEQTAREMVLGAIKAAKADMAVATTGIAGPGGGTKEKPVGLVYIACGSADDIIVERCLFNGSRKEIRQASVEHALGMLYKEIMKK
ncbi:MAG: CinA family protein [Lachnospiraceae bacterium]|nr:CinA family protein [Lachnospiraceae bacterium]